ncbi:MAG: efflux RND transporter periplasmic adaptor subunit, partial [Pseudomonadota bacterium]|nr:efflux RND transporter periplasmic adaptor subunit [Pseudomonadota bacterium]
KSGTLDGGEIRGFFTGEDCPKPATAAAPPPKKSVPPLSDRGKAADKNKNGVIDRDEAGGPLKANFDDMDCDKSGTLDGGEIRGFFTGEDCPKPATAAAPVKKQTASGAKKRKGGRPPRAVRVDAVITEPLSQTAPVIGRLVARQSGDVAARINGAVVSMPTAVGDRVKKGEVIATLAQERLTAKRDKYAAALTTRRAMVQVAHAEYSKKNQELRRVANLRKSSAFSRARFEDLERDAEARRASLTERRSQLKEAKAELDQATIDLYNSNIRAPYDGVVSQKHTEVGAYVNVGNRVVTLISDNDIEVEAEVPSRQIPGLIPGAQVRFELDDGTRHRARVRSVVPSENVRTRTRPVRFTPEFGATTKPFAVNQTVTVRVPIGKIRQVATVHKDAIVYNAGKTSVRIVRRGKAFPRPVRIGVAVGSRFVVLRGLKPGDQVVTHGNETLPPGAEIRILTGVPPQPRQQTN